MLRSIRSGLRVKTLLEEDRLVLFHPDFNSVDTAEEMMALMATLMKNQSGGPERGNYPENNNVSVIGSPGEIFIAHWWERIIPNTEILRKVGKIKLDLNLTGIVAPYSVFRWLLHIPLNYCYAVREQVQVCVRWSKGTAQVVESIVHFS